MNEVSQISEFGKIFLFIITGFVLAGVTLFMNRLLSPNKPNPEKLSTYECGEEPIGSAWLPFNTRFYVIALVFLLFDVEMVFIFPWATVYANADLIKADARWGVFTLIEMFVFAGILILGLVYVWRKGDLEWIKPQALKPVSDSPIPLSAYEQLNIEQAAFTIQPFKPDTISEQVKNITPPIVDAPAAAKKPMFKPTFKKAPNE